MLRHPPSLRSVGLKTQRGAYAITLAAILGAVSVTVLSFSAFTAKKALLQSEDRMKSEVVLAMSDLQAWYEREADALAQAGTTPSEEQLQAVLRRPYPGLRVAISTSMAPAWCSNTSPSIECIPWRKIVAWFPASVAPTSTVVADGIPVSELTGDAVFRVYSSQQWWVNRYVQTGKKMTETGRALMAWFSAQQALDPDRVHGSNFWRSQDCSAGSGSLPCIDSYTSIAATTLLSTLGLRASDITSALGSPIQISNLEDSSTSSPFSISLRVVTPWGAQIKQRVIQP